MYTQCTRCSTAFRIEPEDLAMAAGEVRCGHCGATFNALLNLSNEPPGAARDERPDEASEGIDAGDGKRAADEHTATSRDLPQPVTAGEDTHDVATGEQADHAATADGSELADVSAVSEDNDGGERAAATGEAGLASGDAEADQDIDQETPPTPFAEPGADRHARGEAAELEDDKPAGEAEAGDEADGTGPAMATGIGDAEATAARPESRDEQDDDDARDEDGAQDDDDDAQDDADDALDGADDAQDAADAARDDDDAQDDSNDARDEDDAQDDDDDARDDTDDAQDRTDDDDDARDDTDDAQDRTDDDDDARDDTDDAQDRTDDDDDARDDTDDAQDRTDDDDDARDDDAAQDDADDALDGTEDARDDESAQDEADDARDDSYDAQDRTDDDDDARDDTDDARDDDADDARDDTDDARDDDADDAQDRTDDDDDTPDDADDAGNDGAPAGEKDAQHDESPASPDEQTGATGAPITVSAAGLTAAGDIQDNDAFDEQDARDLSAYLTAPRSTARLIGLSVASLVLALLLLAQLVHHFRAELATHPVLGSTVRSLYDALDIRLVPDWDVNTFGVEGNANIVEFTIDNANGQPIEGLRVSAIIVNNAVGARPAPVVKLLLQNRWGETVAARDFQPSDYDSRPNASNHQLAPGEKLRIELQLEDPGKEVEGFDIDLCLPGPNGLLNCASELAN